MAISTIGTNSLASGAVTNTSIAAAAGISTSKLGTGAVLQVVQTVKTDTFSVAATTGTWTDITGLSVSITPSSASNKILVMVDISLGSSQDSTGQPFARIVRNSTTIYVGDANGSRAQVLVGNCNYTGAGGAVYQNMRQGGIYLDSPSSTSAVTYKIQLGTETSVTSYVNRNGYDANRWEDARAASSITVMEIAG